MFGSSAYVDKIIANHIDPYFVYHANKSINMGLMYGELTVHEPEIRPQRIESYGTSVNLTQGMLKRLNVKIPWTRTLSYETTEVTLHDIDLHFSLSLIEQLSNSKETTVDNESNKNFFTAFFEEVKSCSLQACGIGRIPDTKPIKERLLLKLLIPLLQELNSIRICVEGLKVTVDVPSTKEGKVIVLKLLADSVLLDEISNASENANYKALLEDGCNPSNVIGKSFRVRGFSSSIQMVTIDDDTEIVPNFINPFFLDMSCYADTTPPTEEHPARVSASAVIDNLEFTPYMSSLNLMQEVTSLFRAFAYLLFQFLIFICSLHVYWYIRVRYIFLLRVHIHIYIDLLLTCRLWSSSIWLIPLITHVV